jgi:DNA-binding response OmpR family regulator
MTKRILVVDDDEMVLMALDELLKPEGYEVDTVGSGNEALQKLDQGAYDLIMTDVIMPEMDGFELCKRIREKEKFRDIPVVFLTASDSMEDEIKELSLGAKDYIRKPVNWDLLLLRVRKSLDRAVAG